MSELVKKSLPQEQKKRTRAAFKRRTSITIISITLAALAGFVVTAVYAQVQEKDKYSLKSPSGIAFSDFKGYEDWAVVFPPGPTKC